MDAVFEPGSVQGTIPFILLKMGGLGLLQWNHSVVHIKCGKGQMGSFDASKQIFLHLKNCNWLYLCAWIKILVCRYQKENGF